MGDAVIGCTHWQDFATGRNWQTATVPSGHRQSTVKLSPVESMTTTGSPPCAKHPEMKSFAAETPWLRAVAPAGDDTPPTSNTANASTMVSFPIERFKLFIPCLLSS